MDRQRDITYAQVGSKVYDAKRRTMSAMQKALDARTAQEYDDAIADMLKAVGDYSTWQIVLKSLEG